MVRTPSEWQVSTAGVRWTQFVISILPGQVIIGISAAFLLWDAIDLGFTISDLVKKQGSKAARTLKEKAEMLEVALKETTGVYCIEMPL